MELEPKIMIMGPAIAVGDTLVIGDLHIGAEESLNKQGYMVPRFQFLDMRDKVLKLVEDNDFDTVVINGDLKHEFGTISQTEWQNTLKLLDLLAHHCKKTILIRGNHDTLLGPIANKTAVEVKENYLLGDILICHGDKIPFGPVFEKAKVVIIGHEHPAVSFKKDGRVESFKCFLKGMYRGKTLIVMPSFNNLSTGSNILSEKSLSPFLEQGIDNFEVFALGDKVYSFGDVATLRDL
ncbi:MAG: metallophosphoesterase [archaeon]